MVKAVYLALCGFWAALSILMVVSPKSLIWLLAFGKFNVDVESRWLSNVYRVLGLMNLIGAVIMLFQLLNSH